MRSPPANLAANLAANLECLFAEEVNRDHDAGENEYYIQVMLRASAFALIYAFASPAFAQESEGWPRFEGLDHQLQSLEQQQVDKLARDQQRDINRAALPNSGVSQAEQALRKLDDTRELNELLLLNNVQRDQALRERDMASASLPSRRIAAHSSLVIADPNRYLLPSAPKGQYYARLEGRFVLVDAMSELVVKVLDPQPTDPTADVPAGPRPPVGPQPEAAAPFN